MRAIRPYLHAQNRDHLDLRYLAHAQRLKGMRNFHPGQTKTLLGRIGFNGLSTLVSRKTCSQRVAILVLGMHRSGTSALAGAMNELGARGPKTLMPATADNPRGYFESLPLSVAHDELLAAAGSGWDDWRQIDQGWVHSRAARKHRRKISALLVNEFGDAPLICLKDPRICRFVPFMQSILLELNFRVVVVLPLRNPREVAYSLKQRNQFPLTKSILLWLRHVLEAEFYSRGMARCFVSYEEFISDWRRQTERVSEKIVVMWPNRSARSSAAIDEFLTADLRRQRVSFDTMKDHSDVVALARDTYDVLTGVMADDAGEELLDHLDLLRAKFNEACHAFGDMAVATNEEDACGPNLRVFKASLRQESSDTQNSHHGASGRRQDNTRHCARSVAQCGAVQR